VSVFISIAKHVCGKPRYFQHKQQIDIFPNYF